MYHATIIYFFIQIIVLFVMPNACYTPMQRYLRFVQWRRICNEKKERDPICLCTNENALLHSTDGMANWSQPTGLNPSRRSRLVS